jgi:type II secretion system protein N
MEGLLKFIKLIARNKGKVIVMLFSAIVFLFLLFPFDDLSDLISTQVARITDNSIYIQFERLKLSLFPSMGIKMDKVYVESLRTPALSASELTITPSVTGIIQQMPYGQVNAKGFLKGDISLNMNKGSRSDNGIERTHLEISAKKISLLDLRELANLPIQLKGQLNLQTSAMADLTFQEQPDIEIDLSVKQFELPPSNINTPMGPLTLPDLKLTSLELKGRLAAGRFIIETGSIGKQGDELQGTIKGSINLNIKNGQDGFTHQVGAYSFDIDLTAKKSFQDRATLFLTFIDNFKTPTSEGAQYKFKVSANSTLTPPNIDAAR